MEHAGHGDLLEYIKLRGAIPEEKAKLMFRQMLDAIDYLHKNNTVHRYLRFFITSFFFLQFVHYYV